MQRVPFAPALGEVHGCLLIDPQLIAWAATRARTFYAEQLKAGFTELVATERLPARLRKLTPAPDRVELRRAGYRRRGGPAAEQLVLTCSVDMHVDDMLGLQCLATIHNDSLEFTQRGGAKRQMFSPGQWTVFNDFIPHEMEARKQTPESGVYIGLIFPVDKIAP